MKTMSVEKVAQDFASVVTALEKSGEEIVVVKNRRRIARLVPEPSAQTAAEILGDLHGILDEQTGRALAEAVKRNRARGKHTLKELRNPWVS